MAHKTGSGSSKNGRDSHSKRLGIKQNHNQIVTSGSILVRQKGFYFKPGKNVTIAKDFTIFALIKGIVNFSQKKIINIEPIKGESEI